MSKAADDKTSTELDNYADDTAQDVEANDANAKREGSLRSILRNKLQHSASDKSGADKTSVASKENAPNEADRAPRQSDDKDSRHGLSDYINNKSDRKLQRSIEGGKMQTAELRDREKILAAEEKARAKAEEKNKKANDDTTEGSSEEEPDEKDESNSMRVRMRSRRRKWRAAMYSIRNKLFDLDEMLKWRIPLTRLPLFGVLALFIPLAIAAGVMGGAFRDKILYADIPAWKWLVVAEIALVALVAFHIIAQIISRTVIKRTFGQTWLYYYLHYIVWPSTWFAWGIFILVIRHNTFFFDNFDTDQFDYVELAGVSAIVLSVLRVAWRSLIKATLLSNLKTEFWSDIKYSLKREKVLQTIIDHAKPRRDPKMEALAARYHKEADLQESLAPDAKSALHRQQIHIAERKHDERIERGGKKGWYGKIKFVQKFKGVKTTRQKDDKTVKLKGDAFDPDVDAILSVQDAEEHAEILYHALLANKIVNYRQQRRNELIKSKADDGTDKPSEIRGRHSRRPSLVAFMQHLQHPFEHQTSNADMTLDLDEDESGIGRERVATSTAKHGESEKPLHQHNRRPSQLWTDLRQGFAPPGLQRELTKEEFTEIEHESAKITDLTYEDFEDFFLEDDVNDAWSLFDKADQGYLKKKDFTDVVVDIYTTRRNLSYTLRDRHDIASVIKGLLDAVFWVAMFILVLIIAGVDLLTQIIPITSSFLALSFMFGAAAKSLVDSFVLVYVSHPFDVGDRISLDGTTSYLVDKIALYTTTAHHIDGRVLVFPNASLLPIQIFNFTRSPHHTITIDIQIDLLTSAEKIAQLKDSLAEFVAKHPTVYKPDSLSFNFLRIDQSKSVTVEMYTELAALNWADPLKYRQPTTAMLMCIQRNCIELGITYTPPPQEVLIRNLPHHLLQPQTTKRPRRHRAARRSTTPIDIVDSDESKKVK